MMHPNRLLGRSRRLSHSNCFLQDGIRQLEASIPRASRPGGRSAMLVLAMPPCEAYRPAFARVDVPDLFGAAASWPEREGTDALGNATVRYRAG